MAIKVPEVRKSRLVLDPHQVVLRPLVTEKGVEKSESDNQYSFEVNPLAGKSEIRDAVEKLFDVRVLKIRTQNRKGKPRRYKFRQGMTKSWKKAIVSLHSDDRIDFF